MRHERTAWALTLTGLIPFAGAALVLMAVGGVWAGPALLALLAWAAAMLAFLGGSRWGAGGADGRQQAIGWLAVFAGWGLLAAPIADVRWQITGFIVAFIVLVLLEPRGAPLRPLRLTLMAGAVVSLLFALVFVIRL